MNCRIDHDPQGYDHEYNPGLVYAYIISDAEVFDEFEDLTFIYEDDGGYDWDYGSWDEPEDDYDQWDDYEFDEIILEELDDEPDLTPDPPRKDRSRKVNRKTYWGHRSVFTRKSRGKHGTTKPRRKDHAKRENLRIKYSCAIYSD
jgi:hypothetical protein